jgi:hypothetical protein
VRSTTAPSLRENLLSCRNARQYVSTVGISRNRLALAGGLYSLTTQQCRGVIVRLVTELKRRNVFRMAALYLVAAWLVMQVAEVVIGLANLPDWLGPAILVLLAIGFPVALTFS